MSIACSVRAFALVGIVSPLIMMFFITNVVYRECLAFVFLVSTGCLIGNGWRGCFDRSATETQETATTGGLSEHALGELKRKRYYSVETTGSNGDAAPDKDTTWNDTSRECRICLSEFEDDEVILHLRCGHIYHELCATTWLRRRNRCPVCNATVIEPTAVAETEMVTIGIGTNEVGSAHD